MREIKFRGKRVDNNQWVYGSLIVDGPNNTRIVTTTGTYEWVDVFPESVGQFTGLYDMGGHSIYEGNTCANVWNESVAEQDLFKYKVVCRTGAFGYVNYVGQHFEEFIPFLANKNYHWNKDGLSTKIKIISE